MGTTLIASCIVAMAVAACSMRQPVEPVQMQTKFDYGAHKPYTQAGTNTIKGQGFLRQQGGGIVTCAGNEVYLMPATSFFREAANHVLAGKNPQFGNVIDPAKADPAYKAMLKQSQCDAQGNFIFSNLPNGNWLVVTAVTWTVGYSRQGGNLVREVNVTNGETAQVLLTDKDFISR